LGKTGENPAQGRYCRSQKAVEVAVSCGTFVMYMTFQDLPFGKVRIPGCSDRIFAVRFISADDRSNGQNQVMLLPLSKPFFGPQQVAGLLF